MNSSIKWWRRPTGTVSLFFSYKPMRVTRTGLRPSPNALTWNRKPDIRAESPLTCVYKWRCLCGTPTLIYHYRRAFQWSRPSFVSTKCSVFQIWSFLSLTIPIYCPFSFNCAAAYPLSTQRLQFGPLGTLPSFSYRVEHVPDELNLIAYIMTR